jgi:acetyltransferase-like isoleucine patch superfamily enzyme
MMPTPTSTPRTLSWDWYDGTIPENAVVDATAYVETTFSFHLFRSELPVGVRIGAGASTYLGTMFDVGPCGQVVLGDYALVHGARIACDRSVAIGTMALISWNVVLMDSYRWPRDPACRRRALERAAAASPGRFVPEVPAQPVVIGPNVWIGFEACILPGVTVGAGAIVGARSVVFEDVEPYTLVAGNPARFIRRLEMEKGAAADAS